MRKLLRKTATVAAALSIAGGGIAGIAGASSAATQGPDSPIKIRAHNHQRWTNNNTVGVTNTNSQSAYTGDAKVKHNTTGGDATSGMASNDNTVDTAITVDNTGGGVGAANLGDWTLNTAGPDSKISVKVSNHTTVTNNNTVGVTNTSSQTATSGDAKVSDNTTGGNATSGDASNTNSTTTTIMVSN